MVGRSIFVCYRREDSAPYAGRLYDRLTLEFGRDRVFFDIDDIDYGDDFEKILEDALSRVSVVLVVIGPNWHSVRSTEGTRRLELPDDYVRREVESTLDRGIQLIPVLVGGAKMPSMDELPEPLQRLIKRQAASLGDATFNGDVERLVASIKRRSTELSSMAEPRLGAEVAAPASSSIVEWDAVGQGLRRLQQNWMVTLPLVAAFCVVAQGLYLGVQMRWVLGLDVLAVLLAVALVAEGVANFAIFHWRKRALEQGARGAVPPWLLCIAPAAVASAMLSIALLGELNVLEAPRVLPIAAAWGIAAPLIACVIVAFGTRRSVSTEKAGAADPAGHSGRIPRRFEFPVFLIACMASAAMLALMLTVWATPLYYHPGLYLLAMFPTLLVIRWIAWSLFTGILFQGGADRDTDASGGPGHDAHREWWNSLLRRLLAIAVAWTVVMGLCICAQFLIDRLATNGKVAVAVVAIATGMAIALGGGVGKRSAIASLFPLARHLIVGLVVTLFVTSLFLAVYWVTAELSGVLVISPDVAAEHVFVDPMLRHMGLRDVEFGLLWGVPVVLVAIALAMRALIQLNRRVGHRQAGGVKGSAEK